MVWIYKRGTEGDDIMVGGLYFWEDGGPLVRFFVLDIQLEGPVEKVEVFGWDLLAAGDTVYEAPVLNHERVVIILGFVLLCF